MTSVEPKGKALFSWAKQGRTKSAMNDKNLIANEQRTPSERRENARKAGKASGEARRKKKSTQELAKMIDGLNLSKEDMEALEAYGVPQDDRSLLTVKLIALHQKAVKGDVQAIRLWLELVGEAPSQKVDVNIENDRTREAYDRAAAAIRGSGKKK